MTLKGLPLGFFVKDTVEDWLEFPSAWDDGPLSSNHAALARQRAAQGGFIGSKPPLPNFHEVLTFGFVVSETLPSFESFIRRQRTVPTGRGVRC